MVEIKYTPMYCCKCNRDITKKYKFYDRFGNRYCYDCWEKEKQKKKEERDGN